MITRVFGSRSLIAVAAVCCLAACSSGDEAATDASGSSADASGAPDARLSSDAASADAALADASVAADADPSACHALGYGGDTVSIAQVATLPTMTGGTIPLGSYDATAVTVDASSSLTGTYRGSWYFESSDRMQLLEEITLNGNSPPMPKPRTLSWSTSSAQLTRMQICEGSRTFDNTYRVRVEGADTYLDVRSTSVMFTFKKR